MAWYNASWGYRKKITIDHTKVAGDETDFPVLISTTDDDFKDVGNGGHVGKSDGIDILFTEDDGETKLDHEIQRYVDSTGEVIAWVEISSLDGDADQDIYMYYGNDGASDQQNIIGTWNSAYKMVHHLIGANASACDDSTTNNKDITSDSGDPTYQQTGKIGYGVALDGNDILVIADTILSGGSSGLTASIWFKPTDAGNDEKLLVQMGDTYDYIIGFVQNDPYFEVWDEFGTGYSMAPWGGGPDGNSITNGAWHLLVMRVTPDSMIEAIVDGVNLGNVAFSNDISMDGGDFIIGGFSGGSELIGIIDEVRITEGLRSDNWCLTEFNNQNSPDIFIKTWGDEETSGLDIVKVINEGLRTGRKWDGLGMGMFSVPSDIPTFLGYIDDLWAKGFRDFRIDIPSWDNAGWVGDSKDTVLAAIAAYPSIRIIWGLSSNETTLTSSNWSDFSDAVEIAAQWAQDNGVFEFQVGNEEEYHNDDDTLTDADVRAGIRTLATACQSIFTNGNISYSLGYSESPFWISDGKGDLDLIAINVYKGGDEDPYDTAYQTHISNMYSEFGSSFYITEFNVSYTSLAHYSSDEVKQMKVIDEMLQYIKGIGVERAYFYRYIDDGLGALWDSGTPRQLWYYLALGEEKIKNLEMIKIIDEVVNILGAEQDYIADSYPESNVTGYIEMSDIDPTHYNGVGQSITGDGRTLDSIEFYLRKTGVPTGNAYAKVFAHSGVFGTSSVPTGAALATSNPIDVSTIDTNPELIKFAFSGANRIALADGTNYVVTVEYDNGAYGVDSIGVGIDASPSHAGNWCWHADGSWDSNDSYDAIFYVNTISYVESFYIHGRLRIISEVLNISEAKNRLLGFIRIISEAINILETKNKLRGLIKIISEAAHIAEAKNYIRGRIEVVSEIVNISELKNKTLGKIRVISEAVNISETKNYIEKILQLITEIATGIEKFFRRLGTSSEFDTAVLASQRQWLAKVLIYFDGDDSPATELTNTDIARIDWFEESQAEKDNPLGSVSANELTLTLKNSNNEFIANNAASPYYSKLLPNLLVIPFLGLKLPDESYEYIRIGHYRTGDWLAPTDSLEASVICQDEMFNTGQQDMPQIPNKQSTTIKEMFEIVFDSLGITIDNYIIDPTLTSEITLGWFSEGKVRDMLQSLAIGGACKVFATRYGELQVHNMYNVDSAVAILSDTDQIIKADMPEKYSKIYSAVSTTYKLPFIKASTQIVDIEEITIPNGGKTLTRQRFASGPIGSIEQINLVGATNSEIASITFGAWDMTVEISNSGSSEDIAIEVFGRSIETEDSEVVEQDGSLYAIVGEKTLNMTSDFIQTKARATAYTSSLLTLVKDTDAYITAIIRGNPALHLDDVITVDDDTDKIGTVDIVPIRFSYTFDGGLSGTIGGIKKEALE